MAEDLTSRNPLRPELPPAKPKPRDSERKERRLVVPFRRLREGGDGKNRRFMLAYLLLGVILGGAAAGFGMLLMTGAGQDDERGTGGWSEWRPTARGEAGVDQIANFVANRYRLPSGKQLVAVLADKPLVQNQVPVSTVAIEQAKQGASGESDYILHDVGGDFMYVMCGLGQNCAIREGPPSVERHRLLRREALELALYTFRYVDGVDSIIAFLPPPPGEQPTSLLYFRKRDFRDHLDRPLSDTLPGDRPPKMDAIPPSERRVIDRLTTKNLFKYEFQQGPDASAILVLTPQFPSG
jgi:hypothetical protein